MWAKSLLQKISEFWVVLFGALSHSWASADQQKGSDELRDPPVPSTGVPRFCGAVGISPTAWSAAHSPWEPPQGIFLCAQPKKQTQHGVHVRGWELCCASAGVGRLQKLSLSWVGVTGSSHAEEGSRAHFSCWVQPLALSPLTLWQPLQTHS